MHEYIEEHLDAWPTLEQMAAAAHLSAYRFARQLKAATGLPPHQHVIARRVERAKLLLQGDLSLAEVAAHRLLGPEPVLPSLQAPRRRHAGAVPDARKNRLTGRKFRQEAPERAPYHFPRAAGP
jgi:AraC-like DNA-binding protein